MVSGSCWRQARRCTGWCLPRPYSPGCLGSGCSLLRNAARLWLGPHRSRARSGDGSVTRWRRSMPEIALLLVALGAAGLAVLVPMWRGPSEVDRGDGDAATLRHRVALEALRDVEADRRAGSLDDAGYAEQLAEAEARAAETRAALADGVPSRLETGSGGRTAAAVTAGAIAAILLAGWFVPGAGIANSTVNNQGLAELQATEAARQERIGELQQALAE